LQDKGKMALDDIALDLQMPVSKTAQVLLNMELNNIITGLPGKFFEIL